MMNKIVIAFIMLLTTASFSFSQTGSLKGKVTTADGKTASDVTILLKNKGKGTSTDVNGYFEFRKLPAGSYDVEISLVGYQTLSQTVLVQTGRQQTVDMQLTLSGRELEEVVVKSAGRGYKVNKPSSSLRLQTPLLEVPQNIQVVTSKTISDQQIFDMLEGVTRNVSGAVRSEHWDNYANITMRGTTIGSFRNGMNVQMPWGPIVEDMSMVDRIEFVKGPAGFMLANGEPSGFYNVVTKKPTGLTKGEATFSLGSFGTYRSTLDLDGKLDKEGKLLYRLNLMAQNKGSQRDYDYTKRYSIVPVLTYLINDKTSITAEYTYQFMQMALVGAAYVFSPKGYADVPRNFTNAEPNLDPTNINDHSLFLTFNHQINSDWKFTTQLSYLNYKQIGSSQWTSWPVGVSANGDINRSISIWDAANEAKLGQAFFTGSLLTGKVRHHVLGGVDMGNKNYMADWGQSFDLVGYTYDENFELVPAPFNIYQPVHGNVPADKLPKFDRTLPLRARAGSNLMTEGYTSLYVQDEIELLHDKVRLTLAGRYTAIKQSSYGTNSDDEKFTPRAGLSVSLNKQTSLYALYDQAFVAQQGYDSANKPFVPVTGNNIEVGLKRDWFGGKWNSTLSAFRIIRNDIISTIPGPIYKAIQTGQTKTSGIEFDIRGELARGLNLTFNYAFTQAEISKDEDPSKIGGAVPGSGFADHISNGWLSYRMTGDKLKGLGISLGYQFQGKRNSWDWGAEKESATKLPDYFRLDGNISWQGSQFSVLFNVNNILNKYLYAGAPYELDNDANTSEYYYQIEPGTNFRFTVGYRF